MKPLKIKWKFMPGKNSVFKRGQAQNMVVEVIDEIASFKFNTAGDTKAFASYKSKDHDVQVKYVERLQKCVMKFPGKKQNEIIRAIQVKLGVLSGAKKSELKALEKKALGAVK